MRASRWFVCTVVTAMALLGAGSATAAVLYSQLDSSSGVSITSQNFEADNDAFDSELADDFVVPAGGGWQVRATVIEEHAGPGPFEGPAFSTFNDQELGSRRPPGSGARIRCQALSLVERTLSWLNRFRRLKIRDEHRADIHLAFLQLGCALISLRFLG